jgi:hypothetical protein
MISDSWRRACVALSVLPLTFAAFVASLLVSIIYTQWWTSIDFGWEILLVVVAAFGLLIIYYQQGRIAGEPVNGESGSWSDWFGWSLLSILPLVPLLLGYAGSVGFDKWAECEETSLTESIIYILCSLVAIPMFVVAAGKAINFSASSAIAVMSQVIQRIPAILPAAILFVVVPSILLELLERYVQNNSLTFAQYISVGLAATFVLFASALLSAGFDASVYRSVEYEIQSNTKSG